MRRHIGAGGAAAAAAAGCASAGGGSGWQLAASSCGSGGDRRCCAAAARLQAWQATDVSRAAALHHVRLVGSDDIDEAMECAQSDFS